MCCFLIIKKYEEIYYYTNIKINHYINPVLKYGKRILGEWNQGRMDLRRTETWVNGIKGKRDLGQTNIHSSGGLDSTSVLLHHYFCC